MKLDLDFLKYQPFLKITKTGESAVVFDRIRRKNVALTPEELLRQLVVFYLLEEKKYNPTRLRVEKGLEVNGMKKRCDVLVFDAAMQPWLLVECKSPKIALTQRTFEQAAVYNMGLQVPFMAITNGLATFCCAFDYEEKSYKFLPDFPDFSGV